MGTTPAGVTKASTLISLGVIGMTPSSNICTEYDKATAGKKKKTINQSTYKAIINRGILLKHTEQWLLPILFVSKLSVFTQKSVIIPSKVLRHGISELLASSRSNINAR